MRGIVYTYSVLIKGDTKSQKNYKNYGSLFQLREPPFPISPVIYGFMGSNIYAMIIYQPQIIIVYFFEFKEMYDYRIYLFIFFFSKRLITRTMVSRVLHKHFLYIYQINSGLKKCVNEQSVFTP